MLWLILQWNVICVVDFLILWYASAVQVDAIDLYIALSTWPGI